MAEEGRALPLSTGGTQSDPATPSKFPLTPMNYPVAGKPLEVKICGDDCYEWKWVVIGVGIRAIYCKFLAIMSLQGFLSFRLTLETFLSFLDQLRNS